MADLRYVWADGALGFGSAFSNVHHAQILKQMVESGQVQKPVQNYVAGMFIPDQYHGPSFDRVTVDWESGEHPNIAELRYQIQQELQRTSRESSYQALAADVEDTEPEGENVGFLHDPHKELYPNLFRGGKKIPPEVKEALKNHVLEPLTKEFKDPDKFIYFTVYGSGISYNWDESGDLDLQLWIDIEKYSATTNDPLPIDDLLADVRRIVQVVNFPSFAELGLEAPKDSLEPTTGAMLIQYYPKPGKGTKDENLASNPYACYDLETDEWLVKPKPIKPKFYGDNFLLLMPKAKDIALQTEALLGEFQRNVLNWQFWFAMYSRYKNKKYREEYTQAMKDATQEKEGIKVLFEGVFGGRAEAYAPGGQGIMDERDMLQKLLEVWGIFQELKHFARVPLPWEEQELPSPNSGWHIAAVNPYDSEHIQVNSESEPQEDLYPEENQQYWAMSPEERQQFADNQDAAIHNKFEPLVGLEPIESHRGIGIWRGTHNPGNVAMVRAPMDLSDEDIANVNALSAAHGLAKDQGSVSWGRPLPAGTKGENVYPGFLWIPSKTRPDAVAQLGNILDTYYGKGMVGIIHGPGDAWYIVDFAKSKFRAKMDVLLSRIDPHSQIDPISWQGGYTIHSKLKTEPWETSFQDAIDAHPNSGAIWDALNDHKTGNWKRESSIIKVADWSEIMDKAQRLRDTGKVQILNNLSNHVIGTVEGDHGTYNTEIWRDDPNSGTISLWNCDCPWSQYSWGRTRQWKKYEGRPCAHTLALYWTALGTPVSDEDQQTIPGTTPAPDPTTAPVTNQPSPLDLPSAIQDTLPSSMPPAQMPQSQPITPQDSQQLTIAFPGALSKWRKEGQFVNGDFVRANQQVDGFDDRDQYYIVPRNMIGEVIWSDEEDTIAIFSIESGQLGPHNVRVTAPTEAFSLVPRTRGTAPRRRR